MSSEIDHPRQRTVAELLAEHGGDGATGRRRRRREAEQEPDAPVAGSGEAAPDVEAWTADRSVLRRPVAPPPAGPVNGGPVNPDAVNPGPVSTAPPRSLPPRAPVGRNGSAPEAYPRAGEQRPPFAPRPEPGPDADAGSRPAPRSGETRATPAASRADAPWQAAPRTGDSPWSAESARARASEDTQATRATEARPAGPRNTGATRAPEQPARNGSRGADSQPMRTLDVPPPPPVRRAEPEHSTQQMPRFRSDGSSAVDPLLTAPIEQQQAAALHPDGDDGLPTAVGRAPAGAEEWHEERTTRRRDGRSRATRGAAPAGDAGGPPTQVSGPYDLDDDHPAGLGVSGLHQRPRLPADDDAAEEAGGRKAGQAWAGVVAQWILGAVGGAALWVGFRYLWQEFTVVAIAAAVLVTIGLVLVVRHLLRNDDRRTTIFAVLVGLLLTASPALLVLLHRG